MKTATHILVFLLAVSAVSCGHTRTSSTIVLIVRHAEKASDAEDSPLTEAGMRRSQALVRVAADAGVSAIYSTQFKRSRDTVQPLAERLGVGITEVPVDLQSPGDYGKLLAKEIMEKHSGQTVVVVGHGNTIPSIVEGLTGRSASLGDIAYSDLLVINHSSGSAKVTKAQYGSCAGG
jgi:broad specificity phosphatase PhoE